MTNIKQAGWNTKNATTLKPSEFHFGIDWSFEMRYCMIFYLNWLRNKQGSKANAKYLLNKKMYILLQPLLISVPIEIQSHTVPHFKAPVNRKVE